MDDSVDDSDAGDYSGTFIVKKEKGKGKPSPSPPPSARRTLRSPFQDLRRSSPRIRSDPEEVYSTVRSRLRAAEEVEDSSSVSGTFLRRMERSGRP